MDTFVPIPDFDGYFINKNGEILSKRQKKDRIMKPDLTHGGYYHVILIKNKKRKHMYIHRLVALTFISNDNNLPFVDHIDKCRTNNSLVNLRWVTRELNAHNQKRHKDNKIGHKHISLWIDKRNDNEWYRVRIVRNHKTHQKYFKTLEEAIKNRDEYLTELGEEIIN